MLIDVPVAGVLRPAVAQLTKMGHLFLLDRETGEPLFPVEERPVAQTDLPGEWTSPTQPFPTFPPPLHPGRLEPEDAFGFTPWDRAACRRMIEDLRNEGIFTPPSVRGSVLYPGTAGGSNWGGGAWDASRRLLVLNQNRIAQALTMVERKQQAESWTQTDRPRGLALQAGAPYLTRSDVLVSPFGVPCSPPPWGTLLAVDLERGAVAWERPFGTTRDMTPLPFGLDYGMPSMGGPIVTATGVVFIGAAMDDYLRAYDVETGEELWRDRLPAGAQATPMTFRLDRDGPQIVVIAAGGHGTLGTTPGDHLIAWALPQPLDGE
jgi:quinoprotein glucose dehydrogenase